MFRTEGLAEKLDFHPDHLPVTSFDHPIDFSSA